MTGCQPTATALPRPRRSRTTPRRLAVLPGDVGAAGDGWEVGQGGVGGAGRSDMVNIRAIVSFAWMAGPPLVAIAVVAVLNTFTAGAMLAGRSAAAGPEERPASDGTGSFPRSRITPSSSPWSRCRLPNSAAVSVLALYATRTLGLDVVWVGVALGVSAALAIPALLLIGRLGLRLSDPGLVAAG